jgi:hypothetical protein
MTISDNPKMIAPDAREVMRVGEFCMGPKALAEYQNFIVKACEITNACSDDLNTLRRSLYEFNRKFPSIPPESSQIRDKGNNFFADRGENGNSPSCEQQKRAPKNIE